jgi:hypothetical protein
MISKQSLRGEKIFLIKQSLRLTFLRRFFCLFKWAGFGAAGQVVQFAIQ